MTEAANPSEDGVAFVEDEGGTVQIIETFDLVIAGPPGKEGPPGDDGPPGPPGPPGTDPDLPDLILLFENGLI